jgi:hypothetical protein
LHRTGALRVTHNGQPLAPGHLDQNKIQSAEFRPERVRLGTTDKIALRGLYQKVGVTVRSGEEEVRAGEYLRTLEDLARAAGGDTPLPARPGTAKIDELKRLVGTEQLGGILKAKDELEKSFEAWTKLKELAEKRVPGWQMLQRLHAQADTLPVAAEVQPEIDAICDNRSLLEDTDHVAALRSKVATALRAAVTEQYDKQRGAYAAGMKTLEADASWKALNQTDRDVILSQVGLRAPAELSIKSDDDLVVELDRQSLAARADAVAAVPERVARALEEAARKLKPKAKRITLRAATLETEEEVKAWLSESEQKLLDAVKQGPVIIG